MAENSKAESLKSKSQSQTMAAKKGGKEGAAGRSALDMGSSKNNSERADEKMKDIQGKSHKKGDERRLRERSRRRRRRTTTRNKMTVSGSSWNTGLE